MAAVLPLKLTDLIAFANERLPAWTLAPGDIGLLPGTVASISTQLNAVTDAVTAKGTAYAQARSATITQNAEAETLRTLLAEAVKTIKAFADTQAKPEVVYAAADIPMPQPPSPAPPPAQPTELSISIDPLTGAPTLRWKCSNGRAVGTSYIIRRRAVGQTPFAIVGITGEKSFTDTTFTAGPDEIEYSVQGTRSGILGAGAGLLVRFGVPGGDGAGFIATAVESKLAA